MPSANTESFSSAPPENRLISEYAVWLAPLLAASMQPRIALLFVFGEGTEAPSRYNKTMASVKTSFLRRSGVRKADAKALSTHPPARVTYVPDN